VKEALKLMRASLPATIQIRKTIDPSPAFILGDPTQIYQIVMNLCTNALHAMEGEGGILDVRLERVAGPGDDDLAELKNLLKLTVIDTGCGMDALTRERIFDPYFTTKIKGKGTGLGLYMVHGIVQNHGGMIKVISAVGQGTTSEVYFPVLENQALHDNFEVEDLPRGSEYVLFIDDEPMLVSLGESMLGRLGYHVVGMSDPHEALEVFRRSPEQFDIVMTDLTMPGISGAKLAGMLSNIKPDIPILLCSGCVKHAGSQPFLSGYIRKPTTVQRLARTVRETLDS